MCRFRGRKGTGDAMRPSTTVLLLVCGLAVLCGIVGGARDGRGEIIGPGWTPRVNPNQTPEAAASSDASAAKPATPAGVPVGSVVAWLKNQTGTPTLPAEWVECNGQTLRHPGSPYDGMTIPNLNGAAGAPARFLRGATQSGGDGGSDNHRHGGFLINRSGPRVVNVSAWTPEQHLPPYYDVVWIMKVL